MSDQVGPINYEDAGYRYRLIAQATSVSTASFDEDKIDKNTQAVTKIHYNITDVVVVNDILKGTVHLPGGLTESFTLTPGPNDTEEIDTGGLFFGVGAQRLGPYILNAADFNAIQAWQTSNFAHN